MLENIVVKSRVTHDYYHSYINPEATGTPHISASHIAVVTFALIAAAIAVGLVYVGRDFCLLDRDSGGHHTGWQVKSPN